MDYPRYAVAHFGTAIGAIAIFWAVRAMFDFDITSSFFPVLPSMMAAMMQGGNFAQTNGRIPETGSAWRFAFIATLISIMLLVMLYFVIGVAYPAFISTLRAEIGPSIIGPTLLAVFVVVILVVNRYALTSCAKMVLKAAEKRGGKG